MDPDNQRQFVINAVPCFSDVAEADVKFINMPLDVPASVYDECKNALKKLPAMTSAALRCTLESGKVRIDIMDISVRKKPVVLLSM